MNRTSDKVKRSGKSNKNNKTNVMEYVFQNFKIKNRIGSGSFGSVYKAHNYVKGITCALKIENKIKSKKKRLRSEHNLYIRFAKNKITTVPREYVYAECDEYSYMMIQLLGKSVDKILKQYDGRFDLGTTMKIALMSIKCLEDVHSVGILHRDIKPNNFMFGRKEDDEENKLYIIDFGLSKEYFNRKTKSHIRMNNGRSMVGTARYVSIRTHQGFEPSRRDDMESLGHMLIYLVKGRLPWQGLPKKDKRGNMDQIKDKKMSTTIEDLCEDLPECFGFYMEYTREMEFSQKPDYEYLKGLFKKSAKDHDIDLVLDWEK